MKNLNLLKTTWVVLLITTSLFVKAQVPPGIVPAIGIPVLVPATVGELNTANGYCQLSYGTSGLARSLNTCEPLNLSGHQNGSTGNSHVVLTTATYDSLACKDGFPGEYLPTIPEIPYWDSLNFGPLKVMKLGDQQPGSLPFASAASTYYFTPTDDQNILFLWVAFVTQAVPWHNKTENALFRVEMTDINGNYVTGDYYNSTFYIIPETNTDPILHPCCQPLLVRYSCPGTINNFWTDWTQLIFDLRPFIGQTVKLRLIVSECVYQAHYTYSYYTGFGVNGNLEVQTCALDSTTIQAPVGFEDYTWYVNNVNYPEFDNQRMITMLRSTSDTLFRCEAVTETGAPFVFDKTINYYSLTPDFTWEQQVEGDFYKVQFTNTSTLFNNTNNGNVAENIENLLWDFGDGITSTELNPIHYYSGIGPFAVKLKVFDNHNLCSEEISEQVLLSGVSVNEVNTQSISCKAYPNPFKEEVVLEISNNNELVQVQILNLLGQVVYSGVVVKQSKVATSHFNPGVYIVKFSKGDQTFYSKIVKE